MQFLQSFFVGPLISTGLEPPNSADLSLLNFHLCGHLKDKVFGTASANIDELKARITKRINKIDSSMLKNVFSNLIKRCQACIQADERHFPQYL